MGIKICEIDGSKVSGGLSISGLKISISGMTIKVGSGSVTKGGTTYNLTSQRQKTITADASKRKYIGIYLMDDDTIWTYERLEGDPPPTFPEGKRWVEKLCCFWVQPNQTDLNNEIIIVRKVV